MNDTYVTLQGWVGTDAEMRDVKGAAFASFRVGCTPRFRSRDGEWHNGTTQWYTVECWRRLAEHVGVSVRSGDAVVVHGRVRLDVWEREDGNKSVTWVVDATSVGHDLTKGTSTFVKRLTPVSEDPTADRGVREVLHSYPVDGPQLSEQGDELGGGVHSAA